MPSRRLQDFIWHKQWTEDDIAKYVGDFIACYSTYASDAAFREQAASGGSVSRLLAYLLETDQIDGALVLDTEIVDDQVKPRFKIARTPEEVRSAQGSKYTAVYFAANALPLVKRFEGRLAIVALPCDATIVHRYRQKHKDVDDKIRFVFTLFCGHNSEPELTTMIVDKLRQSPDDRLVDWRYRYGHWRGEMRAEFEQQGEVVKPFTYFSDYRNLYFFAQPKCHHCFDHYGYNCDISAGDIWSPAMRTRPIKHTALIARSARGDQLIKAALGAGVLHGQREPVEIVLDGQSRTMPFHYNISARARVARLFNMRIIDHVQERVRLVDYMIAFIAILDQRITQSELGRRLVAAMPRPLIRLYLYFLKGLESF